MEDLIKQVIEIVYENELNVANRKREIVHKKFYLYNLLRSKGVKYEHIAKLFNTHHASVIHGIKQYNHLKSINDKILEEDIFEYVQMNLEELQLEQEYIKDEFIKEKMQYYSMKYDLNFMKKMIDSMVRKYDNKLYKELK